MHKLWLKVLSLLMLFGSSAGAATANVTYRGGPVLAKATVIPVFWGASVQFSDKLSGFYQAVLNSAYYDWLKEYDTPTTNIGRGAVEASYADTAAPAGTSITDAQIQTELGKLIDAGKVAPPDANSLYMVHFAPGITIDDGTGAKSCNQFCAYHGSFTHAGKSIYYGVVPDQGGACSQGCAGDPDLFKDTCAVASHELVEATTDPDVNAPAWIDDQQGEIGDICVGQLGAAAGYTVQLEWSQKQSACIDHVAGLTPTFSFTVTPATQTVAAGGAAVYQVATTSTGGDPETLGFAVSGVPNGARGTFDHPSAMTGAPVVLTVSTDSTAAASSSTLTVTVTGATTQVATVSLTITASSSGGTGGGVGSGGGASGGGNGNGNGNMGNGPTTQSGCSLSGGDPPALPLVLLLLGYQGVARWLKRRSPHAVRGKS
jgi:hypothetical protein